MNGPANPAISVFTPIYNGVEYLRRCWDNLRHQTLSDWEWVVVDDGSTDRTSELVEGFDDPRVRFLTYQPNRGRGYARMRGLESCLGDWVVVWDVDDLHCPDRLARIDEARRAGYDFWCSYAAIAGSGPEFSAIGGFLPRNGSLPPGFLHATLACRRDLALAIGYDQQVGRGVQPFLEAAEDRTLMVTLAAKYQGLFLQDVLTLYLADRDVSAEKSIACHRSARRQLDQMILSGVLRPGWRQKCLLDVFFLVKLTALTILRLAPAWYPALRRMRVPNYGTIPPGWVLPPERCQALRDLAGKASDGSTD